MFQSSGFRKDPGSSHTICFTTGTTILTPLGERAVEDLRQGDKVLTRDHGLQPIRWIGQRKVTGQGALAPIRIAKHVLPGARADLLVSPQHRIMFQGYHAELLFGESEVFVTAEDMVNGRDVTRTETDEVGYHHLMFNEHEVIYSNGVATESFHADDAGVRSISNAARQELFTIFPELRSWTGGHGAAARTSLRPGDAAQLSERLFG